LRIEQAHTALVGNYPQSHWSKDVCFKLAQKYTRENRCADAITYFETYLEIASEEEDVCYALYDLGRCYKAMGNLDMAVAKYNQFLDQCSEHPYSTMARKRLARIQRLLKRQ